MKNAYFNELLKSEKITHIGETRIVQKHWFAVLLFNST